MLFELSRDYRRAFELIKNGDRLACLVDYEGCRDIATARNIDGALNIGARGIGYIYLFEDQVQTSDMFEQQCDRLNVEFYLPVQGEQP